MGFTFLPSTHCHHNGGVLGDIETISSFVDLGACLASLAALVPYVVLFLLLADKKTRKRPYFIRIYILSIVWSIYDVADLMRHVALILVEHAFCSTFNDTIPMGISQLPNIIDYIRGIAFYFCIAFIATSAGVMLRLIQSSVGKGTAPKDPRYFLYMWEWVLCSCLCFILFLLHLACDTGSGISHSLDAPNFAHVIDILGHSVRIAVMVLIVIFTASCFIAMLVYYFRYHRILKPVTAVLLAMFLLPLAVQAVALLFDVGVLLCFLGVSAVELLTPGEGTTFIWTFHRYANISFNLTDAITLLQFAVICFTHLVAVGYMRWKDLKTEKEMYIEL
ncbi:hypothetical protein J8273_5126 [Carpediemonas membranifera]|uniref:Uncharacterized protein n=1 Tax=Carpediemonas membranifera TaxID=201153 RepID=A0A8J6B3G5_9EUKA|nr:hypothetical protein J8273_5126 [Carpediemonas membranifera]|eukprot:KAG9392147.1 hypothetical protein J8273_5126 [Carpediemonas membranifera]